MKQLTKAKLFLRMLPLVFIAIAYQNCAKLKFSAEELINPTKSTSSPSAQPAAAPVISDVSDSFKVTGFPIGTALDIAWIVDNSSTMGKVATAMQEYLPAFIENVNSKSDVRMALISKSSGTYSGRYSPYVSLPSHLSSSQFLQIDVMVDNRTALQKLSSYTLTQLLPSTFFRANARKMFVVATDNDSSLSANDFLTQLDGSVNADQMGFFAFVGVGSSAPCAVEQGLTYLELITKVFDGRSYNICGGDWKSNFDDLTSHFIRPDNYNVFSLSQKQVLELYSVSVNGLVLSSSEYTFDDGILTIIDKTILTQGAIVKIEYKAQLN